MSFARPVHSALYEDDLNNEGEVVWYEQLLGITQWLPRCSWLLLSRGTPKRGACPTALPPMPTPPSFPPPPIMQVPRHLDLFVFFTSRVRMTSVRLGLAPKTCSHNRILQDQTLYLFVSNVQSHQREHFGYNWAILL